MTGRGFASPNYSHDRAQEMRRKGGKRKVPKGFAMMSIARRKEIARMGAKAGHRGKKKKPENPFDIV